VSSSLVLGCRVLVRYSLVAAVLSPLILPGVELLVLIVSLLTAMVQVVAMFILLSAGGGQVLGNCDVWVLVAR